MFSGNFNFEWYNRLGFIAEGNNNTCYNIMNGMGKNLRFIFMNNNNLMTWNYMEDWRMAGGKGTNREKCEFRPSFSRNLFSLSKITIVTFLGVGNT